MDLRGKLEILADAAKYDASCASGGSDSQRSGAGLGSTQKMGICHSFTPDGRCVSLLKILLTNYCIFDCQYCVNRISSDVRRARFSIAEVVGLTLDFYRRNYIEGLFLSSGIIQSPDYTMEQLVEVVRQLREVHGFRGYIHVKTIPGADVRLLEQAGRYADRISVNIELPTASDLAQLAPEKRHPEIESAMHEIQERVARSREEEEKFPSALPFAPAGQSTQLIVGATPTTDRTILANSERLYAEHSLRRVYYSAFSPIPHADNRLPSLSPPLMREHRLYQADWLMRFYGFEASELTSEAAPNLQLQQDPKLAWALAHLDQFPVDVNRDDRERLLRVPGLGAKNVSKIVIARKQRALRVADLKRLRVSWKRAQAFIVAADYTPARLLESSRLEKQFTPPARQLLLFDASESARTGEL